MSRTHHPRRPRGAAVANSAHRYPNHGRWFAKHVMWSPCRAPGMLDREIEIALGEHADHTTVWNEPDYTSPRAAGFMEWDAAKRVDGCRYNAKLRERLRKLRKLVKQAQRGDLSGWRLRFKGFDNISKWVSVTIEVDYSD